MALGQLLSVASILIAVATFVGLGLQRGIVISLREQTGDYEKRIAFLEAERTRDQATINQQRGDLAAMQRVVTGEVQWQAISDLLDHHHKRAEEQWRRHEALLVEIRDELRDLLGRRSQ